MSNTDFDSTILEAAAAEAMAQVKQAGAAASKLVEAWVRAGNAGAVQEAALHATGEARKCARRGLNVLKSRGVPVPPRVRETAKKADGVATEALMLAPDSSGVMLLAFMRTGTGGQCRASLLYLQGRQRVLKVDNIVSTPAKLKAQLASMASTGGYRAVAVPIDWARSIVEETRSNHKASKAPEPLGISNAASVLQPLPSEVPEHPFDAEGFALAPEDAKTLASDSGGLHHLPEFRTWLPDQAAFNEMLRNVGTHLGPGGEASQDEVAEHLKKEMLAATDRYFTPDHRADLVRRMKDSGISVVLRENEQVGLKLAATIQTIEACGLVTDPPQDVPFLRAFFEKAVSYMLAQTGGRLQIPTAKKTA